MLTLVVLFSLFILYLSFRIFCEKKSTSVACLVGKTAIVTGGNSGLGYATCQLLASRGCRVIIADRENAEKSRMEIIQKTENLNIFYEHLDLSSLKSVREFSEKILRNEEKIDILINNAGIGASTVDITEDGLNFVMQVNYFGGFLLTHLLLGRLKAASSARIIFLSSAFIYLHNLQLATLNQCEYKSKVIFALESYSNSKLCNVLAAQEFQKKLSDSEISTFSVDPGMVNTLIVEKVTKIMNAPIFWIWSRFWSPIIGLDPLSGAQTILHLATSNDNQLKNSSHYLFLRPFYKPSILKDQKFCDEIWRKTEDLVKLRDNEKLDAEDS